MAGGEGGAGGGGCGGVVFCGVGGEGFEEGGSADIVVLGCVRSVVLGGKG